MIRMRLHDFRHGLRVLLAKPGFALAAILSLAIGIGANTTVFSVARALLFAPVRGDDAPERLVELGRTRDGQGFETLSYPDFREYARADAFAGTFAYRPEALNVTVASGEPQRAFGLLVSGDYFTTLRAAALHGRLLGAADDAEADPRPVAVASYAAWQKYFAGDAAALGRSVSINGRSFTLIGVAAPQFHGHIAAVSPEFYLPLHERALLRPESAGLFTQRGSLWLLAGARLKDGVSIGQARAEVATIAQRLATSYPDADAKLGLDIAPLRGVPATVRGPLAAFSGLLFALIGLILLVACVNVAGMLIARGESRRHEIAMRFALGASRGRVIGQLFAESLLLATAAGALGIGLARWWRTLIVLIDPPTPIPLTLDFPFGWPVLAFALVLTFATALLFGLLPAWRASNRAPRPGAANASAGVRASRLREALVVIQIALTLTLLIGAGLFAGALQRAAAIDVGFDVEHVVSADFDLEPSGYAATRSAQLQQQLLERLRAVPGVEHAAIAALVPLSFERMSFGCVEGSGDAQLCPDVNLVSDGFFATLGMPVRGRAIDASDTASAPQVGVVNHTLAQRIAPAGDALGRSFAYGEGKDQHRITVVGVVDDGKYASLAEEAQPFLFLPLSQWPRATASVLAKTPLAPGEFSAHLRSALHGLDAALPPPQAHPLRDILALSLLPQRIAALIAAVLGAVGLLLAAIGLYGLIAFHVASRTREFGVKLALGATRRRVLGEILGRGAWLCGIGLAAGAAIGVLLDRLIAGLLFGAGAGDVFAFGGAAAVLAAVALLACWLPARRAARANPMVALRYE
jgi:predicted permease